MSAATFGVWIRKEAQGRLTAGDWLGGYEVCTILGAGTWHVDCLTWGGVRDAVPIPTFLGMWERAARRPARVHREVYLFGATTRSKLDIWPTGLKVFVWEWDSLSAVRKALAELGLRLGRVMKRSSYGPPCCRATGTTWSVRGHFREPRSALPITRAVPGLVRQLDPPAATQFPLALRPPLWHSPDMTNDGAADDKVHPFERAGLGVAPFRFAGLYESKFQAHPGAPVRAGSSCDYCPQAIMIVCVIEDAHGRRFKVGCDCARKAGGAKLVARLEGAMTERERQARKARSEKARAARRAKPASKAQIEYARKLGATDAELADATIDTCSALIDRLRSV